jgi:hypothetical protein
MTGSILLHISALFGLWLALGGFVCFFESRGRTGLMLQSAFMFLLGAAFIGASTWGLLA